MLQYNEHIKQISKATVNKQADQVKLAFDVVKGRRPWQDDPLFDSGVPPFQTAVAGPDDKAYQLLSDCIDWMGQAVKRLFTESAHAAYDRVRNHVLFIARHNEFEIPLHTHMHPLIFHLGLFYSEQEIGLIMKHYTNVSEIPATGNPFIGIIIHASKHAPELHANQEFFAELSKHVRTKMYVVDGDASGFNLENTEVFSCTNMSHQAIAEQVRKDNPILVLNASATSIDVTKLGVAPRVMQFVGLDVPIFNRNWITHRYMNVEQRKRMASVETPLVVDHYHHMAKIAALRPETRRTPDDTFRVGTHFRDIKASTRLRDTILSVANAHETIEVVVSVRDATGSLVDIDHPRVVAGWHPSMDDPNPFRETIDLIVDSPILWSMHHTMLVWMRAGVPIAVVKPTYDTVFSAHATDMLTMIGMTDDLYFENDDALAERIKIWVEQPDVFSDVRKRFDLGVSRIPSNDQAARNFYAQIVDMGLLSNEGLPEHTPDKATQANSPADSPEDVPGEATQANSPADALGEATTVFPETHTQSGGKAKDHFAEICLFGCTMMFAIASSLR
jgi:hypothetical protein